MKTAASAGALTLAALWLVDRWSLPEASTLSLESRLLATHLVIGAGLGALAGALVQDRSSRWRTASAAGGFTLAVALTALFGTVAHYPQLVADRWWLGGGTLAMLQRLVTHTSGPLLWDALLITLLGGAATMLLAQIVRSRPKHAGAVAMAAGVFAMVRFVASIPARSSETATETAPDVLVIASAALRLDRLESPDTMPYVSSRIPDGTLYRHAVTPIARSYPGWVSTLTGTEPRAHDIRHGFPTLSSRRDIGPTLFTELRDRGYFTFVTADSAGAFFSGLDAGFELVDAPGASPVARSPSRALSRHTFSLPLLRFRFFRNLFPEWRLLPTADPGWIVDEALPQIDRSDARPYAGLVVLGNTLRPYGSPYPYYLKASGDYRGPYLYHVPPVSGSNPTADDVRQIRARFDGALSAVDGAIRELVERLRRPTLVIITGAHGEELYETPGLAGHGNALESLRSQATPILLLGPGIPHGTLSNTPARHYDLPATVLDRLGISKTFGQGTSLFDEGAPRPACVETGIWFSPKEPPALRGERLTYAPIADLLEIEPSTGMTALRRDRESLVETTKARGLILGGQLYHEQLTPEGPARTVRSFDGVEAPVADAHELARLFEKRCIDGDENLSRLYGTVVFERIDR